MRGDFYNGLTTHKEAEPRLGVAYNIKRSNTVLRVSYARTLETPFNENLVLSSIGCANPVLNPLLSCSAPVSNPLSPGWRNEFHAGIAAGLRKVCGLLRRVHLEVHPQRLRLQRAGDHSDHVPDRVEQLQDSRIRWPRQRAELPRILGAHGLLQRRRALLHSPDRRSRRGSRVQSGHFRIDHDEKFNQTTHLQYQPWKTGPWFGFNWRYDSGLVAGPAPCAGGNCANGPAGSDSVVDVSGLSPDQQFEAGLFCGGVHATPPSAANPIGTPISPNNLCPASQYGSTLLTIPAPGTENDDHNPPRIAPRSLFDLAIGHDNLFHGDRYKWSAQFTAINLTNNYALYNFLSTFSGTHYVTPRSYAGQIGFHF